MVSTLRLPLLVLSWQILYGISKLIFFAVDVRCVLAFRDSPVECRVAVHVEASRETRKRTGKLSLPTIDTDIPVWKPTHAMDT